MIIVDSKEATNIKLLNAFHKAGVSFKVEPLEVGDFTNSKQTFIVERKGFTDFWKSMTDHRLDKQAQEMYEIYNGNRFIFVEFGALRDLSFYKKNPHWIYSKYGEIENWGCKYREYIDFIDLVRKLDALDKYLGSERVVRERRRKIKGKTVAEKSLMGFDNVGEKTAKLMLKEMGDYWNIVKDVVNNDGKKLLKIKGVGKKTVSKMKKALLEKL